MSSREADGPAANEPRAAYFHVPFCAHRCGYCDFTLISGRDDLVGDYLRSLEIELDSIVGREARTIDTLFWGGGTPTHPRPDELRAMLRLVAKRFHLAAGGEFSVEANPLDLTDEKIDLLMDAQVNRISLGVQSFSEQALRLLERDHSPRDIHDVMQRLRLRCQNVSLDLIFGVPGQTLSDWRDTLDQAIAIGPTHISTYGLTFEQGTAFWNRRERGDLLPADEELEREQYALAMEVLPAAGYEQYEISNFAKPGFQCRHNQVYWNGDEYWAFGPGAASYVQGKRQTNIRSVYGWLGKLERKESPVADAEELDADHRARELIYLGLRRNAGIQRDEFYRRTGRMLDAVCGPTIRDEVAKGLLVDDGSSIRLTTNGRFVADRVVMEFL